MDWDALMPAVPVNAVGTDGAGDNAPDAGDLFPSVPSQSGDCSHLVDGDNQIGNNGLSDLFPLFPVFPPENEGRQWDGDEIESPGAAGGPVQLRVRNDGTGGGDACKPARALDPWDDRITCGQCLNYWDGGVCAVAKPYPGALVVANRGYRPVQRLMRCRGFSPVEGESDRRTGLERWPGL